MIQVKSFDLFKTFVDDVKTAEIPFRIIGMQYDNLPIQTYFDQKARPAVSFSIKLLLCSSMATVLLDTFFPIEEKEHFNEFVEAFGVCLVDTLELNNGVVFCR